MHTVTHNLLEGFVLVLLVLITFLGAVRGPLIVASVIPIALLTAFLGLRLRGMPANLISLGAIDFGILIDGAVIYVEAIYHLSSTKPGLSSEQLVQEAGVQVVRPIVFSLGIIVASLAPIVTMERVEGRIFAPMAMTYAFALLGALVGSLTLVPALARLAFKPSRVGHDDEPRFIHALRHVCEKLIAFSLRNRVVVGVSVAALVVGAVLVGRSLGTEFIPELNEGGMLSPRSARRRNRSKRASGSFPSCGGSSGSSPRSIRWCRNWVGPKTARIPPRSPMRRSW